MDLVKPGAAGHIDLTANHRMDAPFFGRLVKIDHAIHTAVVGNSHRVLSQLLRGVQQPFDPAGAVQKAVFRVYM